MYVFILLHTLNSVHASNDFIILFLSQEAYIADLDAKSGASLKLTLLNPRGRIWTMVAGGGASVVYRYTIIFLFVVISTLFSQLLNYTHQKINKM